MEAAGSGKPEEVAHEPSVPPASPVHREASVTSLWSPMAKRARSVPPILGYSRKADGGPTQKAWVSQAEQAKAKSKTVSRYALCSCAITQPEPEVVAGPSSASMSSCLLPVPDIEGDEGPMDMNE